MKLRESGAHLPWYDSQWLARYRAAEELVRRVRPAALRDFVGAFEVLRTRPDYRATLVEQPFDDDTMAEIRRTVATLRPTEIELHEIQHFGRFVVHRHPYFTELQERVVPLVSEVVGEPLESSYTFLSLYNKRGVCEVHMDALEAKFTLDVCIDQNVRWPIHVSQVVPWPGAAEEDWNGDWNEKIKRSPENRFSSYTLNPGQALIFAGSSQWHYREAMPPSNSGKPFCTLLFFHFIPKGTAELIQPGHWARLFGIPELSFNEAAGAR